MPNGWSMDFGKNGDDPVIIHWETDVNIPPNIVFGIPSPIENDCFEEVKDGNVTAPKK